MTFSAMKKYVVGILLSLTAFSAGATTSTLDQANFLFANANAAYKQQAYEKAVEGYEQTLQLGIENPALYYNLGTAYARIDRTVEAFAFLTRAARLTPRNDDVRANLERARNALYPQESATQPTSDRPSLFNRIVSYLSASEWIALLWVGFTLLCCGVGLRFLLRQKIARILSWTLIITGSFVTILLAAPAITAWYNTHVVQQSIVLQSASVQSGPADRYPEIATVRKGQIVRDSGAATESDLYRSVRLDDGTHGYIKSEHLISL